MNYELALKLKKAGFPQTGRGTWNQNGMTRESLYNPTLEELIEACGNEFGFLGWRHDYGIYATNYGSPAFEYWYHMGGRRHEKNCSCKEVDILGLCKDKPWDNKECFAKTYLEAVANLWLELHSKNE